MISQDVFIGWVLGVLSTLVFTLLKHWLESLRDKPNLKVSSDYGKDGQVTIYLRITATNESIRPITVRSAEMVVDNKDIIPISDNFGSVRGKRVSDTFPVKLDFRESAIAYYSDEYILGRLNGKQLKFAYLVDDTGKKYKVKLPRNYLDAIEKMAALYKSLNSLPEEQLLKFLDTLRNKKDLKDDKSEPLTRE